MIVALSAWSWGIACGQENGEEIPLKYGGYAMKGKVYPGEAEWLESWAKVPSDEWLELMKQWNPEKFDAKEWVRRFKAAGFRYIKITTKQHEGFCLWPSEYSPYNVARTPYGKDILVELVQAAGRREWIFISIFRSWTGVIPTGGMTSEVGRTASLSAVFSLSWTIS